MNKVNIFLIILVILLICAIVYYYYKNNVMENFILPDNIKDICCNDISGNVGTYYDFYTFKYINNLQELDNIESYENKSLNTDGLITLKELLNYTNDISGCTDSDKIKTFNEIAIQNLNIFDKKKNIKSMNDLNTLLTAMKINIDETNLLNLPEHLEIIKLIKDFILEPEQLIVDINNNIFTISNYEVIRNKLNNILDDSNNTNNTNNTNIIALVKRIMRIREYIMTVYVLNKIIKFNKDIKYKKLKLLLLEEIVVNLNNIQNDVNKIINSNLNIEKLRDNLDNLKDSYNKCLDYQKEEIRKEEEEKEEEKEDKDLSHRMSENVINVSYINNTITNTQNSQRESVSANVPINNSKNNVNNDGNNVNSDRFDPRNFSNNRINSSNIGGDLSEYSRNYQNLDRVLDNDEDPYTRNRNGDDDIYYNRILGEKFNACPIMAGNPWGTYESGDLIN